VFLPGPDALAAAKMIPKATRRALPILSNVYLTINDAHLYLAATDLERPQVVKVRHPEVGNFPNIEAVMPKDGEHKPDVFGIQARYLARVAQYRLMFEGAGRVKITSRRSTDPVSFEWTDGVDGHIVHVVVMPMRL
jgi:hypothetical protein